MFARARWDPAGEFVASRHGVLTRKQASSLGLSNKAIRSMLDQGLLREPVAGVLVVHGSPPTWRQKLATVTVASNGAAVAGFRSAAALHQLDSYDPGPVEVIVHTARRELRAHAIVRRGPLDLCDVVQVDGIRCTTIARTLVDIASVDTQLKATIAFESAWRAGASLGWIESTARRLQRPRQHGSRVILQLVEDAQRTMKPTESALWNPS